MDRGYIITIFLSLYFGSIYRIEGILMGVNIGFCLLVASLTAHVFAEYPFPFKRAIILIFIFDIIMSYFGAAFFVCLFVD